LDHDAENLALRRALEEEARRLGFSLVGIAPADPSRHMDYYRAWLDEGRHGDMAYLARADAVARRGDLTATMEGVRSVIVVAHEYNAPDEPTRGDDPSRGIVARYARGRDYHDVVKDKLLELLRWLDGRVEGGARGRAYVDTGPILERELAQRAGLGWFGRNTMLINPTLGSYFFLGLLLVDVRLPGDEPFVEDRCGTCRACLDACPTGALLGRDETGAPVIDAPLCISYLTIELRGPIPVQLRSAVGNRIFGCDICQEVCPWNERFARQADEPAYRPRAELDGPSLVGLASTLLDLDETGFRTRFRASAIRRAKRGGMLRNVCVALGNRGSKEAEPVLLRALEDVEALVRGHAAWALGRIGSGAAAAALRAREGTEEDAWVRSEIAEALAGLKR
jgi:epoxyqueuosine reductase